MTLSLEQRARQFRSRVLVRSWEYRQRHHARGVWFRFRRVLADAKRNIAAAGVDRWVKVERADVLERAAPAPAGVMIANPPYGERIGSKDELAEFYPRLGSALKKNYAGWRCHFFTADLRLPKLVRLQPSRKVPLFNGALECRLYEFRMVAGSHRRA